MTRGGRFRLILVVVTVILIVGFYVARHWLSPEALRTHRDDLLHFTSSHYLDALFLVVAACLLFVAISVPVSGFLMVLAGMLFGRWIGAALVALFATLGAALAMLIVRYLVQDFVRTRLRAHRRAQRLLSGLDRHRGSYLLFLRLAPGFPFWLTNVIFGLTDITAWRFLCLTLVGIVPDSFIYSNIGANLATMKSARDMLSPASILALALLAISCLSPVLIHELERRKILPPGWPLGRA